MAAQDVNLSQEGLGCKGVSRRNWEQCFAGPQVMKTRLEADEVAAQLERCDKENKILKDEMNKEIEAVLLPSLALFPCPIPCLSPSAACESP